MYAAFVRNPRLRGVVKSFDATAALKVPGVQKVFKVRMGVFTTFREGVAVVANSTWAALQGKKALVVEWDDTGFEHINTADIYTRQQELLKTTEGFLKPYYESVKNLSFAEVQFETPIPTMWWRSVYASTNGFAYESFLDEIAHAAGKDSLDLRRQYLQEERCQKLIDKMEEVSGWKNRKKNEGYGEAITECFSSTVGQVVKVSKDINGKVKIDQVWAVMDCGWYVNPDIIRAQVEGSIVMGLGAATIHEITFKDGLVEQRNFYDYKMPRITDIPPIEVHIMENDENAGGVGEPGLPAFAPALTNAIFDLTGKRIRKLPFSLSEV